MSDLTEEAIACRCGRMPESNTERRGYSFSLSCKCGGEVVNFVARSHTQKTAVMNWNDLIAKKPFRNYVQRLPEPDADPVIQSSGFDDIPDRHRSQFNGGAC